MKIRNDFVTNSSSSSFILGFKNDDDIESVIRNMISNYESDKNIIDNYTKILLSYISHAKHLTANEVYERNKESVLTDIWIDLYLYYSRKFGSSKDACNYLQSDDGQKEIEKVGEKDLDQLKRDLESHGADYFVQFEISNKGMECDLEQHIMRDCDLTVKWFDLH